MIYMIYKILIVVLAAFPFWLMFQSVKLPPELAAAASCIS
jgi:hypothetical protein